MFRLQNLPKSVMFLTHIRAITGTRIRGSIIFYKRQFLARKLFFLKFDLIAAQGLKITLFQGTAHRLRARSFG